MRQLHPHFRNYVVKERLTGAIILVALFVLLVPELLSGPKSTARTSRAPGAAAAVTSPEEPPLRSYTIDLADDARPQTGAAVDSGPGMPQPSGPEQPAATQSLNSQQSSAGEAPAAASPAPSIAATVPGTTQAAHSGDNPVAKAPAARSSTVHVSAHSTAAPRHLALLDKPGSGWAVQLGVFANRANAEHLALEVRIKGFKASVSEVTSATRKLYRVRVGPAADRAAAQELQDRLKAAGRPVGAVVPYS